MSCASPVLLTRKGENFYGKVYNEDLHRPCGRCPQCKKRRVSDWVLRMVEEEKVSSSAFFVTLTYSQMKVPITKNGFMTCHYPDVQKFFKRLRKLQSKYYATNSITIPAGFPTKLRYYAVSEYGSSKTYGRPHYHIILFNLVDPDFIPKAWIDPVDGKLIGNVHCGKVTRASIAYTTKYIDKESRIPIHKRDDREPERSYMSKGIGKNFLTPQMVAYFKADIHRLYHTDETGKKIALPRYYRERIFNDDERLKQNHYIARKLEEDEQKEIRDFKAKYKKTIQKAPEFNYWVWKASNTINEYKTFYYNQLEKRKL